MDDHSEPILSVEPTRFEMVPHWIMRHEKITGNALRLYLQLRSYAGSKEIAWPSKKTLAKDLGVAVNTIESAINVLLEIGCIQYEARFTNDGRQTSNLYRVLWEDQSSIIECDPPKNVGGDHPKNWGGEGTKNWGGDPPKNWGTNLYLDEAKPIEPRLIESIHETASEKSRFDVSFDEFWKTYPRRSGKIKAKEAFRKVLKTTDAQTVIDGAKRYADDPNRQDEFTAHPTTWLREGRWDDDPLPERGSSERTKAEIQDDYFAKLERETRQYDKERADAIARGENFIDYSEWSRLKSSGDYRTNLGMVNNAF